MTYRNAGADRVGQLTDVLGLSHMTLLRCADEYK
jgi:hypothetical protein